MMRRGWTGLALAYVCGSVSLAAVQPPTPTPAAVAASPDRVIVTAEVATARSCAEASCRTLIELPRGQAVTVLKAEGGWYQVMLRLPGNAMTTGWVEATAVAPAAAPAGGVTGARVTAGSRPGGASVDTRQPSECLTCVATRQPTRAEWEAALAATASVKADPALRDRRNPTVLPGIVDDRSASERMRDEVEKRYGADLKRLSEVASTLDGDLEQYLTTCYDRFLPPAVEGAAPRTPSGQAAARPANGREARLAIWNGNTDFAWVEPVSTPGIISGPRALCPGLWSDVLMRARDLDTAVRNLEFAARQSDIYPGVVREVLAGYGLAPR